MPIIPQQGRVGIVGGGISGLTYAYFLGKLRPDVKIDLYEKSARCGGYIRSKRLGTTEYDSRANQDYTILEKGPRTLRGESPGVLLILDLLFKCNAQNELLGISKNSLGNRKYLLSPYSDTEGHSGKLSPVPYSFASFLRFLFDPLGKGVLFGLLKEPFVRSKSTPDETVEQFVSRRFNKSVSDNVVSAIMHGIYAGDVAKLSAASVLSRLVDIERQHGSIVRYGASQLLQSLKKKTPEQLAPEVELYSKVFKPAFNVPKTARFLRKFPVLTMRDGLESLVTVLQKNLPANVAVHTNVAVRGVAKNEDGLELTLSTGETVRVDHLRLTVNGPATAAVLQNAEIGALVAPLEYTTVVLANVYLPALKLLSHPGFGFLVPKTMQDETQLLGVIFDSDIEQSSRRLFFYNDVSTELTSESPISDEKLAKLAKAVANRGAVITNSYTKLTLMLGGHQLKKGEDLPTRSRVHKIVRDVLLSKLHIDLDKCNGTEVIEIEYWTDAIPQYRVGHEELKKKVAEATRQVFGDKVTLGGTTFGDGVGVPDCVVQSFTDAYGVTVDSEFGHDAQQNGVSNENPNPQSKKYATSR
ncbi:hypothetical protein KL939_002703 [Ogataea angusta]|nr:hypothetical protein KL939_002703 [Ogataea angusta]